ncbi:MAG: hypothetical protein ABSE64_02720 [Vulcanimicrobiaceae bacterium]|jgi:hypothetical protein
MRSRRPQLSLLLVLGGVTLLVAIFIGEKMGERVLSRSTETAVLVPEVQTAAPVPTASADEAGPIRDWRKLQVVTVATDPGFPDPRVTPTPTPKPKPTPTPSPTPTPYFFPTASPEPTEAPTSIGSPNATPQLPGT